MMNYIRIIVLIMMMNINLIRSLNIVSKLLYSKKNIRSYVIKQNIDNIIDDNNNINNNNNDNNNNNNNNNNIKNKVEDGHVYFVATPLGNLGDITDRPTYIIIEVEA